MLDRKQKYLDVSGGLLQLDFAIAQDTYSQKCVDFYFFAGSVGGLKPNVLCNLHKSRLFCREYKRMRI